MGDCCDFSTAPGGHGPRGAVLLRKAVLLLQRVELRPLLLAEDSFKKVVVSRSYGKSWIDDNGILRLGLMDFLLDKDSLDR